ncbi:MAG: COX15/CtaA family protein [Sphingomonadaceae bacterium]|nr:COX15/CtaA family protein [Sphingomonadaceae bacterium]
MVVVGGITRLTESGLSITTWDPLFGAIPPLNGAQWLDKFAAYKRIPQYAVLPGGMTLAAFKAIFFWEYVHRLLGRVIGIAFAGPLVWYWAKGVIPAGYKPRLLALLALGGLQGAVGWWMVASGLSERTEVSHIRLAVHLVLALILLGGLVWTALDLRGGRRARLTGVGVVALLALAVQIKLGAFVAGLRAGYLFPSWPLMDGRLFPEGGWNESWTALRNAIDNPVVVQFLHRWWAWAVVAAMVMLARAAKRGGDRRASVLLHAAVGTQILLGIATLLSGVEIVVAVLHQAVGALTVAAAVNAAHAAGRRA